MIRRATSTAVLTFLLLLSITGRAQKPELVMQTGHSYAVWSVSFSPDGKILASGSADRTVKLWDASTGAELITLKGHAEDVNSVAISPDGKIIASGSSDCSIKLWDALSGAELRTLKGRSVVRSVAFSPDGKTLASAWPNTTIELWDISTGTRLRVLPPKDAGSFTFGLAGSVAFSPDGKTLAAGSATHDIQLWHVATGAELRSLKGHAEDVSSVIFSPDGKTLASGSWDRTIRVWDVSTGTELRNLKHASIVGSVAFNPDGKTLASVSNTIKLWDVGTGTELRELKNPSVTSKVFSVIFSPDGKTLASGYSDGEIRLRDVASGTELRALERHSSEVTTVVFSPDGKTLANSGQGQTIKLWDIRAGTELRTLKGNPYGFNSIVFSPDGKTMADLTLKLWDVSTGVLSRTLQAPKDSSILAIALSPDGKTLASGVGSGERLKLWDVATGAELRGLIANQTYIIRALAFSPDGRILATINDEDETIKLWNVSTGEELRTLRGKGPSSYVISIAFSPDGKTLAGGHSGGEIKLWEFSNGTELRTLTGGPGDVRSVAFSPDGKTLASGSWDNMVKLWDAATGAELYSLKRHSSSVVSVAFSPDSKYLASGSLDTSIRVWEVSSGKELVSLISFDERDWVVVTPDGLFDGSSPAAWSKILWRFNNNTFDHAPVEAFFNEFYYPGLLQDIFAGKRPKAPSNISQKDRQQPQLRVAATSISGTPTVSGNTIDVAIKIDVTELRTDKDHKSGSGAQDVRLFRNGSLVKVWRGDVLKGQSSVTLEATVPIVAGENKFTAYAFNHDNVKSSDAELTVTGADILKRQGTAYILSIGVNNYANHNYNLKYAVADAEDFAAEVKRQQESLKRYAKVEVIALANRQATKANITQKVAELAKQVQPEDAVIVFFAGHGTAHGNQFYLIPHDLGYRGSREGLTKTGLQTILAHSTSDRELEKLFEGIDASQLLLVIDACNSGQALEAEEKRRGPMNSKGLAQLAYEKGMYVMTAAQSYQAAIEAERFGHGYLTYALVEEGLKKGSADREPKNGAIDIREWLNFATDEVPRMQEQNSLDALRGRGKRIIFVGDGRAVGIPKTEADARDNIQRPRVFYRRELEANPLVVGAIGSPSPR